MSSRNEPRRAPPATVLFVDDDDVLRELCADALTRDGYEVVQAACGEQGIECAATLRPRVVVTDVNMPGMSGIELCDYFLCDYPAPAPAVVVISGVASAEVEARRRGAAAFLTKPFELDELLLAVKAAIGGAPTVQQAVDFAPRKARTRATSRAVASAAVEAGLRSDPEILGRTNHVASWLGRFYDHTTVSVLLPRDRRLAVFASSNPALANGNTAPAALIAIAESVLETASTLIVPDVGAQPWLGTAPHELRSVVAVPFRYEGVAVGALCVVASTPRHFGTPDAALLEHLAMQSMSRLTTRETFLTKSWLIGRESFRRILEIEANAAVHHEEAIAILLFRVTADRKLGELLKHLPSRRMQLGELGRDVVGISVRGEYHAVRAAAKSAAVLVRANGTVRAAAELFLGPPILPRAHDDALPWAERLLDATIERAEDRSLVVVDVQAAWSAEGRR